MESDQQRRGRTVRALWHGVVLAESSDTISVEGHYFPPESVRWEHLVDSAATSMCVWKGRARYLSVAVDDVLPDAAWYYPKPWPLARALADRWRSGGGVRIEHGESGSP